MTEKRKCEEDENFPPKKWSAFEKIAEKVQLFLNEHQPLTVSVPGKDEPHSPIVHEKALSFHLSPDGDQNASFKDVTSAVNDRKVIENGDDLRICITKTDMDNMWVSDVAKTVIKDGIDKLTMRIFKTMDRKLKSVGNLVDVNQNPILEPTKDHVNDKRPVNVEHVHEVGAELNFPVALKTPGITESDIQELIDYAEKQVLEANLQTMESPGVIAEPGNCPESLTSEGFISEVKRNFIEVDTPEIAIIEVKTLTKKNVSVKTEEKKVVDVKVEERPVVDIEEEEKPIVEVKAEEETVSEVKVPEKEVVKCKAEGKTLAEVKAPEKTVEEKATLKKLSEVKEPGITLIDAKAPEKTQIQVKAPERTSVQVKPRIEPPLSGRNEPQKTDHDVKPATCEPLNAKKEAEVKLQKNENGGGKHSYAFISTDARENVDNFHAGWAPLRDAPSDEARYRLIRERWRNLSVPDPSKNLSYRHAGRFEGPERKNQQNFRRHMRTMSCTHSYETMVRNLNNDKREREHNLMINQSNEINNLHNRQQEYLRMIQRAQGISVSTSDLHFQLSREMAQLFEQHAEQMKIVSTKQEKEIRKLQEYMMEVRTFHQFYEGLIPHDQRDLTFLTEEQIELKEEVEKMFQAYRRFYR